MGLEESGDSDGARLFGDFQIELREDGTPWELGRGAMGVTYRALDRVLRRKVALKVTEVPANASDLLAARERFLREARAAAGLRHPNIAGVFQFGSSPEGDRCYCAMELVEGETLEARVRRDGPLRVSLGLEVASQITKALIAAGEGALVHRDLKPGNIMLVGQSRTESTVEVKVIDFGLAKASSGADEMALTRGGFVGTPAFASPEQFGGKTIDARTDIYALGVTLWFALTGRLPFPGTTIDEIRERQTRQRLPLEQLRARGVPAPVIDLLRSCLAVRAVDRPASARELLRALEACRDQTPRTRRARTLVLSAIGALVITLGIILFGVVRDDTSIQRSSAPPAALEKGIAVLPFENLSSETNDAFLADGIQDDVLTSLGKIKDLRVIARASVMEYRDAAANGRLRDIGRALGISHLLTGSVRRNGERLVINVALVDASNSSQVWAERYERTLIDTLPLQGELALEIARALSASLSPAETTNAAIKPTDNPDAYLLYLRAREADLATIDGSAGYRGMMQLYQQAIDLDPNFALARARLSICASELSRWPNQSQWKTKAWNEAREALRLRPDLGEARLAMANCYLWIDGDTIQAQAELDRAAELLPNSAEVPLTAAFLYKREGKYRERLAALHRAEALDPRSRKVLTFLFMTQRWVRDWPEAIRTVDRLTVLNPHEGSDRRQWARAGLEFQRSGDFAALTNALAERDQAARGGATPDWLTAAHYDTAMLERDYATAARFLADVTQNGLAEVLLPPERRHPKSFHEALLLIASGAEASNQESALHQAETDILTEISMTAGTDQARAKAEAQLSLVYAFLGRKEEAVSTAQRAVEVHPGPTGSIEKNSLLAALALVYARTGESEKAIDLIERLLRVPGELQSSAVYDVTLTNLKWRWQWDPLRHHPRFQKILAGPEPPTVY